MKWTENDKKMIEKCTTSKEAIEKYFKKYPESTRTKGSVYTYWAWKHNEWKSLRGDEVKDIVSNSVGILKGVLVEAIKEEIERVSVNDLVQFAHGKKEIVYPIGKVISIENRARVPKSSQKMLVRFNNFHNREVYVNDYKVVERGKR